MSWQTERAEQRRLNDAARAEQARQDAIAAAQIEAMRARAQTETEQARREQAAVLAERRNAERRAERDRVRDRRRAAWGRARGWVSAHTVDLMVYPLAVVSAVMAVPAMAAFGHEVYGSAAGYALPVITELGMWAFAFAVHLTRHRADRDGVDRPVWALQVGVWSFAAVAAGLNFLHGLSGRPLVAGLVPGPVAGVVMAVASVAGVMAHQLVTAAPRRDRGERETARIERRAMAKTARVRRAAVRAAVAEIDHTGAARLLFTPGHYRLTRSRVAPWRHGRLTATTLPALPVTPALDSGWDDLDHELAALIAADAYPGTRPDPEAGSGPDNRPSHPTGSDTGATGIGSGGGVATLDPDQPNPHVDQHGDQHGEQSGSTPIDADRPRAPRSRATRTSARKSTRKTAGRSVQKAVRKARSIEELRTALHAAIDADPASIDPTSAESIRRALRCSPARARQLRDTYRPAD
ncbi:hypothetical protein [Actinophytocola gossypii]|uniref:DUF2637 domain-containing protein n=1 Tax=Actinophytocola gossypii TaxID=2812003 RepID=A0ABT2JIS2_9PSEU|nr:hypothetical protein [Actinophytocola gossypii]MCT2587782.1 hypothetical protein [Actinophytocola gossypii]